MVWQNFEGHTNDCYFCMIRKEGVSKTVLFDRDEIRVILGDERFVRKVISRRRQQSCISKLEVIIKKLPRQLEGRQL